MFPPEDRYDNVALAKLASDIEDELRLIGVHVHPNGSSPVRHPSRPTPMLHFSATFGSLAFSDRVQNPDKHEQRSEFREVERQMVDDEFEATKARIKARGLDGFFEGDEDQP